MSGQSVLPEKLWVRLREYLDLLARKESPFPHVLLYVLALWAIVWIFYDSPLAGLVLSPLGLLAMPLCRKAAHARRMQRMSLQMRDVLHYLAASLSAGKSVESAMKEAESGLSLLYPDTRAELLEALHRANLSISMNQPVEEALLHMAEETGLPDMHSFASIFSLCKRSGGNLVEVMRNTTATLREKLEIQEETETLIVAKRMEQRILSVSPFALVLMLRLSSDDFMLPLFHTGTGRVLMSVALVAIGAGIAISARIMRIRL